jgi:hypothetical protein
VAYRPIPVYPPGDDSANPIHAQRRERVASDLVDDLHEIARLSPVPDSRDSCVALPVWSAFDAAAALEHGVLRPNAGSGMMFTA